MSILRSKDPNVARISLEMPKPVKKALMKRCEEIKLEKGIRKFSYNDLLNPVILDLLGVDGSGHPRDPRAKKKRTKDPAGIRAA